MGKEDLMSHDPNPSVAHTQEAMEEALRKMTAVADAFYRPSTRTGVHAFIEFCGFMNEYINVCRTTMESGGDFMDSNTHNGKGLDMQVYQARYLAEKFDCIFGPTLRSNPKFKKIFMELLFPRCTTTQPTFSALA